MALVQVAGEDGGPRSGGPSAETAAGGESVAVGFRRALRAAQGLHRESSRGFIAQKNCPARLRGKPGHGEDYIQRLAQKNVHGIVGDPERQQGGRDLPPLPVPGHGGGRSAERPLQLAYLVVAVAGREGDGRSAPEIPGGLRQFLHRGQQPPAQQRDRKVEQGRRSRGQPEEKQEHRADTRHGGAAQGPGNGLGRGRLALRGRGEPAQALPERRSITPGGVLQQPLEVGFEGVPGGLKVRQLRPHFRRRRKERHPGRRPAVPKRAQRLVEFQQALPAFPRGLVRDVVEHMRPGQHPLRQHALAPGHVHRGGNAFKVERGLPPGQQADQSGREQRRQQQEGFV